MASFLAQPRQSRLEAVAALDGLGAALALLFDHLRLGLGDELLVAELLVDLVDLDVFLGDLLFEPRASRPRCR